MSWPVRHTRVVYENPIAFLGQSPKFDLVPRDEAVEVGV